MQLKVFNDFMHAPVHPFLFVGRSEDETLTNPGRGKQTRRPNEKKSRSVILAGGGAGDGAGPGGCGGGGVGGAWAGGWLGGWLGVWMGGRVVVDCGCRSRCMFRAFLGPIVYVC